MKGFQRGALHRVSQIPNPSDTRTDTQRRSQQLPWTYTESTRARQSSTRIIENKVCRPLEFPISPSFVKFNSGVAPNRRYRLSAPMFQNDYLISNGRCTGGFVRLMAAWTFFDHVEPLSAGTQSSHVLLNGSIPCSP